MSEKAFRVLCSKLDYIDLLYRFWKGEGGVPRSSSGGEGCFEIHLLIDDKKSY